MAVKFRMWLESTKSGYALTTVILMGVMLAIASVMVIQLISAFMGSVQHGMNVERAVSVSNAGISSAADCVNRFHRVSWAGQLTPDVGCENQSVGPSDLTGESAGWTGSYSVGAEDQGGVISLTSRGFAQVGLRSTTERVHKADIPKVTLTADPLPDKVEMVGGAAFTSRSKITNGLVMENNGCGINGDSRVYCWGSNNSGMLGDGTTQDRSSPVPVNTSGALQGKEIVDISMGHDYTCALDSQGKVYCWGSNGLGKLGIGSSSSTGSRVPVEVDTSGALSGKFIVQISAGYSHACALDNQGKAYCWGDNNGAVGDGTISNRRSPVAVNTSGALNGKFLVHISAGNNHTCAVDSQGKAYCWGGNVSGALGNGKSTTERSPSPVVDTGVLDGKHLVSVSASGFHTCALDIQGKAFCWGTNNWGTLGNGGEGSMSREPVAVKDDGALEGRKLVKVVAAPEHNCAIDSVGVAYCWGGNGSGKLGDGESMSIVREPMAVYSAGAIAGKSIVDVSAGSSGSCVMDSENQIYCWGSNSSGGLGIGFDGLGGDSLEPLKTNMNWDMGDGGGLGVGGSYDVISGQTVSTSYMHSCIVSSQRVYCWGRGTEGQLGQGMLRDSPAPVSVRSLTSFTQKKVGQVAVGAYHSCALADGDLYCWGQNSAGQLGDGSEADKITAIPVDSSTGLGDGDISQIGAGYFHTCALVDGEVYCWGSNDYGQLGNGTNDNSSFPQRIDMGGAISGRVVSQISVGAYHTCALAEGQAFCWGHNDSGALGDGTLEDRNRPVHSSGGELTGRNVSQISAGGYHSCALADGSVYCWGRNNFGQSARSDYSQNVITPRLAESSLLRGGISEVSAAAHHSCALSGGDAYCWGDNGSGRLGVPMTITHTHDPQLVTKPSDASGVFSQVSAGAYHNCGVIESVVYCWGYGVRGMLGDNSSESRHLPARISRIADINRLIRY